jgi:hypothetical protein
MRQRLLTTSWLKQGVVLGMVEFAAALVTEFSVAIEGKYSVTE